MGLLSRAISSRRTAPVVCKMDRWDPDQMAHSFAGIVALRAPWLRLWGLLEAFDASDETSDSCWHNAEGKFDPNLLKYWRQQSTVRFWLRRDDKLSISFGTPVLSTAGCATDWTLEIQHAIDGSANVTVAVVSARSVDDKIENIEALDQIRGRCAAVLAKPPVIRVVAGGASSAYAALVPRPDRTRSGVPHPLDNDYLLPTPDWFTHGNTWACPPGSVAELDGFTWDELVCRRGNDGLTFDVSSGGPAPALVHFRSGPSGDFVSLEMQPAASQVLRQSSYQRTLHLFDVLGEGLREDSAFRVVLRDWSRGLDDDPTAGGTASWIPDQSSDASASCLAVPKVGGSSPVGLVCRTSTPVDHDLLRAATKSLPVRQRTWALRATLLTQAQDRTYLQRRASVGGDKDNPIRARYGAYPTLPLRVACGNDRRLAWFWELEQASTVLTSGLFETSFVLTGQTRVGAELAYGRELLDLLQCLEWLVAHSHPDAEFSTLWRTREGMPT